MKESFYNHTQLSLLYHTVCVWGGVGGEEVARVRGASAFKVIYAYLTHYLITYLLTYSMEQSPSWEANWFCS